MPIDIENATHWRTNDLKRVLKAAFEAGGVKPDAKCSVSINWTGQRAKVVVLNSGTNPHMVIGLPRRGPKDPHRIPMMAVALAAVEVPEGATVLPLAEVFRMANLVAYYCIKARQYDYDPDHLTPFVEAAMTQDHPPKWAPVETFIVQKYADPTKDGTYQDFVRKKERLLRRAEQDIARYEKQMKAAEAKLKKAQARKRSVERSLQAARARRA